MASREHNMDKINEPSLEYSICQLVNDYPHEALSANLHCPFVLNFLPRHPRRREGCSDKSVPTVEGLIQKLIFSLASSCFNLVASLVYLSRMRSRLQRRARGIQYPRESIATSTRRTEVCDRAMERERGKSLICYANATSVGSPIGEKWNAVGPEMISSPSVTNDKSNTYIRNSHPQSFAKYSRSWPTIINKA